MRNRGIELSLLSSSPPPALAATAAAAPTPPPHHHLPLDAEAVVVGEGVPGWALPRAMAAVHTALTAQASQQHRCSLLLSPSHPVAPPFW